MEPIARRGKRSNSSAVRGDPLQADLFIEGWSIIGVCIAVFGPAEGSSGLLGKAIQPSPQGLGRVPPSHWGRLAGHSHHAAVRAACARAWRIRPSACYHSARDAQSETPPETEPCNRHKGAAECHSAHHPMLPLLRQPSREGACDTFPAMCMGRDSGARRLAPDLYHAATGP